MRDFWKNECDLFFKDMENLGNFFLQPVTFSGLFQKSDLMLKPSEEEIIEKADTGSFWKNEWDLFMNDMDNVMDFLFQPVKFK